MADALRERGLGEPAASLTAEVGLAAFRVAFERWLDERTTRPLAQVIRASLDELQAAITSPHGQPKAEPGPLG